MTPDALIAAAATGALGAAVVNALFGMWRDRVDSKRNLKRWKREQRLAAYLEFGEVVALALMDPQIAAQIPKEKRGELIRERLEGVSRVVSNVELLGPKSLDLVATAVLNAATDWAAKPTDAGWEKLTKANDDFQAEAKKVLELD